MNMARPLWTLQREGHHIDAELVGRREDGWELRVLRDRQVYASERFTLHAEAVTAGERTRQDLLNDMAS